MAVHVMTPRISPAGLARAGFATLAVVLAIFAIPATRGSVLLLPALLAVGVAGFLLASKRGAPVASRGAGGVFAAYMTGLIVLFVAQSPFTLGKDGRFASGDAQAWALPLFETLLQALPVVLVVGAVVAAWPFSANAGRAALAGGLVLLGAFFALDWLSTPSGFDTVSGAETFARAANWSMSLAVVAVLAAVIMLFRRDVPESAGAPESSASEP